MSIDFFVALLPWLAILACPLVMVWMMRGMSGEQCHPQAKSGSRPDIVKSDTGVAVDDEIQQLRARLARLEAARQELHSRREVTGSMK